MAIAAAICFHWPVAPELLTGLIGVAGALVGGLATFSGTWINARSARLQSAAVRVQAVQDRRYDAHLEYIRGVARFYEAAREVRAALADRRSAEDAQRLHIEAYSALRELEAAAEFAGPGALRADLRELHDQLRTYSQRVDEWFSAGAAYLDETGESLDDERNDRFGRSCASAWTRTQQSRARYLDQTLSAFSV
jgi:phage-related protein